MTSSGTRERVSSTRGIHDDDAFWTTCLMPLTLLECHIVTPSWERFCPGILEDWHVVGHIIHDATRTGGVKGARCCDK